MKEDQQLSEGGMKARDRSISNVIAITGATGFIGRHLIEHYLNSREYKFGFFRERIHRAWTSPPT